MPNPSVALVVTSIAAPNKALQALARGCQEKACQFIVIGDQASPPDFDLPGCQFFSLEDQYRLPFKLARLSPIRHYARKNLGYLIALRQGANVIIESDDDNLPSPDFWSDRVRRQSVKSVSQAGWINVYRYFTDANIWPRGLPLDKIQTVVPPFESLAQAEIDCPIQQGLADENPDVDAVYRLALPLPQWFRQDRRIALGSGSWSPFNSQNTTWWRDAFPLLYLPSFCSFRMTDIWRSFVAQRIAWVNDWGILFHEPTVRQERNEHNLMRDFRDEVPGYLHNEAIGKALSDLTVVSGEQNLADNLRGCYQKLVEMRLVAENELELVEAWIEDLNSIKS
jgi:hypothetical protein